MYHLQGPSQLSKTEKEQPFQQEEMVHQTWDKCYCTEASHESSEIEKRKHTEELHASKKMSASDSGKESMNSSSSKEGEVKTTYRKFIKLRRLY